MVVGIEKLAGFAVHSLVDTEGCWGGPSLLDRNSVGDGGPIVHSEVDGF